jgi:hypothetical protein
MYLTTCVVFDDCARFFCVVSTEGSLFSLKFGGCETLQTSNFKLSV